MEVRRLTRLGADLRAARALADDTIRARAAWRCSPGVTEAPSVDHVRSWAAHELVLVAHEQATHHGLVLARLDGTVKWLICDPDHFADAATALLDEVLAICGRCRGQVENAWVRDALVAAGCERDDGIWIHWGS